MAKTQMLSFPIRLPDCMQGEALRLLDASRPAINDIIEELWPKLDEFAGERTGGARKQVFETILPLLTAELIKPAEGKRKAQKDYRLIKEKVTALREAMEDADSSMALTNVVEQAANYFLETESWPATYEDLQPVPVLAVGQLTEAFDDGMAKGQTYRAKIDLRQLCDLATHHERTTARLFLQLRAPNEI